MISKQLGVQNGHDFEMAVKRKILGDGLKREKALKIKIVCIKTT